MMRQRNRQVEGRGAAVAPRNLERGKHARRRGQPPDLLQTARAAADQMRLLRAQMSALAEIREAARTANQRFADLYDFVPIPYLVTSDLGIIEEVNEIALGLLGGLREWVVGRPIIGYIEHQDMKKVLAALNERTDAGHSIEVRLRGRDGIRPVQMTIRRGTGLSPSRPAYQIALVDLTDIRRLEEERRHAEHDRMVSEEAELVARAANAAKDEFLAMLSHELRTPLTPILAAVDSLVSHETLPERVRAKIEIVRRNVKAEARLIDDLLDLARITRKKLELQRAPTDLHDMVTEVAEAWTPPLAQRDIALEVSLGAETAWVKGDAARLEQVLRNILNNAAKFTEPGGRIRLNTSGSGGRIAVTVADSGIGMTREEIDNLFTPFVQSPQPSARRGLGLGLVISKAILEAHQGVLEVRSAGRGTGTTVRFEMGTIERPAEARVARSPELQAGPLLDATVLLVEDDPDSAEMLAMLLSCEGFRVRTAASVRAARALVDSCDVVVSDIALPDGSGLELMRELRERGAARGVALSGYGSNEDRQRSLAAGFEEHLTKPADLGELVAAVRRLAVPRV